MKELKMALLVVLLCLVLGWGISVGLAEDNLGSKEKQRCQGCADNKGPCKCGEKKDQRKGQEEFNKRMPPQGPGFGGFVDFMRNAKVEAEMKRHMDTMKGFLEEARELKKKIIEAVKAKIDELKAQGADREKVKEEIRKLVESYRPEAEAIAGKITAELEQHHQNLARIIKSEEASIKEKITEHILSPMKPGKGGFDEKGQGKGHRGKDEQGRPERRGQTEVPDDNETPEPFDSPMPE
jgi:hypothetical protein